MAADQISEYERERRGKLQKMRELGVDPYGQQTANLISLAAARDQYQPAMGHDGGPSVKVAGRIIYKRDMGKLSFVTLRDASGDLQLALDKKRLDPAGWQLRDLLDLGDQVVAAGRLGTTNKGEVTVWADSLVMAAKALLPPPAKHQGLGDIQLRYRQRYVDLWANPPVMQMMLLRSRILAEIRRFMHERDFVEVETPMLQTQHGGAAARPFRTLHNALDIPLYMRIAPELFLKRLLVGGMPKIFELNRNFRNEGISPRHNPEFTMLEAYEAFGNWETMADLIESLICHLANALFNGLVIEHASAETERHEIHSNAGDAMTHASVPVIPPTVLSAAQPKRTINLSRPWKRAAMASLVEEKTGWKFDKQSISRQPAALAKAVTLYAPAGANAAARSDAGLQLFDDEVKALHRMQNYERHLLGLSPAEQLVELYEKLVEPTLINPCFVTRVPSVAIPLAKKCADDPYFADVYELAINGQEISPGYSELNDPDVQAENFQHQVGDKEEQQVADADFITALKYGMPPAGGLGLGIDRLIMMLTGADSIRDVIAFPLMKPTFIYQTIYFSPGNADKEFWSVPADYLQSVLQKTIGPLPKWREADDAINDEFHHRLGGAHSRTQDLSPDFKRSERKSATSVLCLYGDAQSYAALDVARAGRELLVDFVLRCELMPGGWACAWSDCR